VNIDDADFLLVKIDGFLRNGEARPLATSRLFGREEGVEYVLGWQVWIKVRDDFDSTHRKAGPDQTKRLLNERRHGRFMHREFPR
jgi:hypothetical protein